jgi:hypothetical protein
MGRSRRIHEEMIDLKIERHTGGPSSARIRDRAATSPPGAVPRPPAEIEGTAINNKFNHMFNTT